MARPESGGSRLEGCVDGLRGKNLPVQTTGRGRESLPGLPAALVELRDAARSAGFGLDIPGADEARAERDGLVQQVDDYLLPRLASLDAPLLAVVGGSTGAGKSTLVNSVVGQQVTAASVLRPTTRAPVLVCAPSDRQWFIGDRILPGLARTTETPGGPGTLHIVTSAALPAGLALIDAPDIDSVVSENRALATQLLAAADLWVFVTTAARYADAVPWDLLRGAQRRNAAIGVVLNRVPAEAAVEVPRALQAMLAAGGLGEAELFAVADSPRRDGLLPEQEIAPVRDWLQRLAADADARAGVIRRTLSGALADLDRRAQSLASADAAQGSAAAALAREVEDAYASAQGEIDQAVRSGTLLRGEVLARWQEFVGTGELLRSVQATVSRFRDRVVAVVSGRPTADNGVQGAVESEVESLVRAAADSAAERVVSAWRRDRTGRHLLAGADRELARSSPELDERLPAEVRAWQGQVLDLVREQGADKRTGARIASYTVNGAGLAVMLAVFAQTGGLTGAEVAIAGGTSAAGHKVLEAIFGDQAVRSLAKQARSDLEKRVAGLLRAEEERFIARIEQARPPSSVDLAVALRTWRSAYAGRAVSTP